MTESNVIHLKQWLAANAAMRALRDRLAPGVTFFSICSGIEAASVAWNSLGWRAVGFAEIDKFPSAVLAHHYPQVRNHGDFTRIDTTRLSRVDILCGGTPCQAFSVAGQRGSLDDARGNLTLAFVDLAHEIQPRNIVWENVPGVLSTKDNAFGCFLAGLVGAADALPPPNGRRWPNAGMVAGPKGRAAWRVLDAQFFGLAQRRKRVIVVADFGNGADPAAVLFEPESVRRDSPPCRETGEGVAPTISARTKGGGGLGTDFDLDGGLIHAPEIARCDTTREGSSQDYESTTMVAVGVTGPISHALKAEGADASEDGTGRGTPIICFSAKDYGADAQENLSPTLRAGGHSGSHANAGVMPAITVALRGREGGATAELGGEIATALRASSGGGDKPHVLAVAYGLTTKESGRDAIKELCPPLRAESGDPHMGGRMAVAISSAVRRLTPRECERLQGFPDTKNCVTIRVWSSEHLRHCASVETQSLKSQTFASNADANALKPNANVAGLNSSASHRVLDKPAAVHVLLDLERNVLQLRNLNESIWSVNIAENVNSSPLSMPVDAFARLIARMPLTQGRGTQTGKAALPQNTRLSSRHLSGSELVHLCGQEIAALVGDATKFTTAVDLCMKSTTSEVGLNFRGSEQTWKTWSSYVVAAISGFIPEQIPNVISYDICVETRCGYTRIPYRNKPADQCPDGPRYKALGNSWAVPLFTWLGRRIAARLP